MLLLFKTKLLLTKNFIWCLLLNVLCVFFTSMHSTAQSLGSEIGFGLGTSIYQGDLSPHWIGTYNRPGLNFQVMGQKNLLPALALRVNYAYASISDNEESYEGGVHQLRNFSFKTSINELSAQLVLNPQFNNGTEEPGNIRPYFFGGIGIAFLRIERDFSRFNRDYPYWQSWVIPGLQQDSMTVLPKSIITYPVGVGLRYQIGDNFALYGELSKRLARTEYLDGFSKAANRQENDGFSTLIFGMIFRLSGGKGGRGSIDCPVNVY